MISQLKEEKRYRKIIEETLDEVLPPVGQRPSVLAEAMRYAVGTGGKRIRPIVCLAAAETVGGRAEDARYPAAAIELLHNYTLVHDDIPCMDNDELRRGKPTVWKKFGEANAVLAGDALQALAFQVAAKAPRHVAEIVNALGERGVGVVRGQVEDVIATAHPGPKSVFDTAFIYEHKTSDLFVAASVMGALAAGADEETVERLRIYGVKLGLAFQYRDDMLDGDGLLSREENERMVGETTAAAVKTVEGLCDGVGFLTRLAEQLMTRAS